jgi:lipopolysaccharide export system permease protein
MKENLKSSYSFTNDYFDTITNNKKSILPNTKKGLAMLDGMKKEDKSNIIELATAKARTIKSHTTNTSNEMKYVRQDLNEFKVEYHRKIKLSFVCLLFFFIGAPFGAIIRKGGLGWPIFFSILIFIFYYAINIIGERLAENAVSQVFTSTWMALIILAPIAIFLTIKSNNDSAIFNKEGYLKFFKNIFSFIKSSKNGS